MCRRWLTSENPPSFLEILRKTGPMHLAVIASQENSSGSLSLIGDVRNAIDSLRAVFLSGSVASAVR